MNLFISFTINFLPLILFTIIACLKVKNFSFFYALLAILLGLFSIIPTVLLQFIIPTDSIFSKTTLPSIFLSALVLNGIIEECSKTAFLFLLPKKEFNLKTFLTASLLAGISFGCFENTIYIITGTQNTILRIFTSLFIHCFCTGISGLFVWSIKTKKTHFFFLISAIFIHGIYNFFACFTGYIWCFSIVTILLAILQTRNYFNIIKEQEI